MCFLWTYHSTKFQWSAQQIGHLQDPVTWYGINYTGTQMTQWDFQNKGTLTSPARLSFPQVPKPISCLSPCTALPCVLSKALLLLPSGAQVRAMRGVCCWSLDCWPLNPSPLPSPNMLTDGASPSFFLTFSLVTLIVQYIFLTPSAGACGECVQFRPILLGHSP